MIPINIMELWGWDTPTNETINMTHIGPLNVTMEIVAHFHDPIIGEQGYFNISLWENDTLLYTNQTTDNVVMVPLWFSG